MEHDEKLQLRWQWLDDFGVYGCGCILKYFCIVEKIPQAKKRKLLKLFCIPIKDKNRIIPQT